MHLNNQAALKRNLVEPCWITQEQEVEFGVQVAIESQNHQGVYMPFCPECTYEYVDGIEKCADCLIELVEELPEEQTPRDSIKWVPLQSLPGPVYAEMIKEALGKHGIPCVIRKDVLSSAYGAQGTTASGVGSYLLVPEDRLEESRSLLQQMMDHI